jgi:hypothetical protein
MKIYPNKLPCHQLDKAIIAFPNDFRRFRDCFNDFCFQIKIEEILVRTILDINTNGSNDVRDWEYVFKDEVVMRTEELLNNDNKIFDRMGADYDYIISDMNNRFSFYGSMFDLDVAVFVSDQYCFQKLYDLLPLNLPDIFSIETIQNYMEYQTEFFTKEFKEMFTSLFIENYADISVFIEC